MRNYSDRVPNKSSLCSRYFDRVAKNFDFKLFPGVRAKFNDFDFFSFRFSLTKIAHILYVFMVISSRFLLLLFAMLSLHIHSFRNAKFIVSGTSGSALRCLSTPRPRDIEIPLDKIDLRYSRSSGPGGQNVNKLNTKVDIRFHVASADWLPQAVRDRIVLYNPQRINKEGDLIVTSQESRYALI